MSSRDVATRCKPGSLWRVATDDVVAVWPEGPGNDRDPVTTLTLDDVFLVVHEDPKNGDWLVVTKGTTGYLSGDWYSSVITRIR